MYLIREVFQARPGKAKDLVKMFKASIPHFEKMQGGMKNAKVMTDAVGPYWTVVFESEADDIGAFFKDLRSATMSDELKDIMKGYMDCVEGGKREVYLIE
ncbi:MAG: hypothetical protein V4556_10115 [Bacteroidota bacterium]